MAARRVTRSPLVLGACAIAVGSCIASAFSSGEDGDLAHELASVAAGWFLCFAPALAVVGLAVVAWLATGGARRRQANANVLCAVVALGVLVAGSVAAIVVERIAVRSRFDSTLRWAESLAPAIERYRAECGAYPMRVDDVTTLADAPPLAREHGISIDSDGASFRLTIPSSSHEGWRWSPTDGRWRRFP